MRRVAVTGLGVVSPIGCGVEKFADALMAGRGGVGGITRFDASAFEVRLAAEVQEPLPGLPENVRSLMADDVKIGFAFSACAEALSQARIRKLNEATLLHLGTSLEVFDLKKVITGQKADFGEVTRRSLRPGARQLQIPLDAAVRLVETEWGRPGRTLTNCSACAAGAQAIGHAFRAVRDGECETAVCGGFDSMINPLGVGGFQLLGALTTDNARGATACRPFDAARRGTVLGEGAAVLVLEPLDKAAAEGRKVLGEVCGYGSTLDAFSLSAPDPEGDGAARAMSLALAEAGIRPEQIDHINTHGTGTQLNDEIEARAIRRVFEGSWEGIPVSATKSMTGHLIGAAGAVEACACLLAFQCDALPPNPCLTTVARGCELNHVLPPGRKFAGEYVLSNSFGFGGQNAVLIFKRCDDAH